MPINQLRGILFLIQINPTTYRLLFKIEQGKNIQIILQIRSITKPGNHMPKTPLSCYFSVGIGWEVGKCNNALLVYRLGSVLQSGHIFFSWNWFHEKSTRNSFFLSIFPFIDLYVVYPWTLVNLSFVGIYR